MVKAGSMIIAVAKLRAELYPSCSVLESEALFESHQEGQRTIDREILKLVVLAQRSGCGLLLGLLLGGSCRGLVGRFAV
jgi:hypothetical protein